ncbi:triose-phosphate isomerase [Candidatus Bathyarchaeota archaeon]|nr:triose-phosphate isomerase [Candidatus Bathyarchaeota archaeon]
MAQSKIRFPLILINYKTFREATGRGAVRIASLAEEASRKTGVCFAVAPQATDLRLVAMSVEIPVFSQHVDPVGQGQFTGHIPPEAVVDAGCVGTLISHSERPLGLEAIEATVRRAREVGLIPVVCADSVWKAEAVASFKPDVIAIEPPELIGTGIPVSRARPEVVSGGVQAIKGLEKDIRVLCGAGISKGEDVSAALRLGAEGVLLASGVVRAADPLRVLLELAEGAKAVSS